MTINSLLISKINDRVLLQVESANYISHDPYDLLGSGPIVWLRKRGSGALHAITSKEPSHKERFIRAIASPVYQNTYIWKLYRFIFGIEPILHPKTMGLMMQAYLSLYRSTNESKFLDKSKICATWLMEHTDQLGFGYYCWGLPWVWPSEEQIPKYGPQSTISAVIGLAFMDLFDVTSEQKYLDVACSVCDFFLTNLNIDKISEDKWAFSYTPYDKTHIVNVNFHCAALLARVWEKTKKITYLDTLTKVCNFSVSEQRQDGAWHYSASIDGYKNAVDNTHTGDNLEYLTIIRNILGSEFPYESAYLKGIEYYLNHFMTEDGAPKYTDKEIYPIESHPACQMLITLALLSSVDNRALPMAKKLATWILKNFMNKKNNSMYYRIYEGGRVDKNLSISWGDAWLIKALSLLLEVEKQSSRAKILINDWS